VCQSFRLVPHGPAPSLLMNYSGEKVNIPPLYPKCDLLCRYEFYRATSTSGIRLAIAQECANAPGGNNGKLPLGLAGLAAVTMRAISIGDMTVVISKGLS